MLNINKISSPVRECIANAAKEVSHNSKQKMYNELFGVVNNGKRIHMLDTANKFTDGIGASITRGTLCCEMTDLVHLRKNDPVAYEKLAQSAKSCYPPSDDVCRSSLGKQFESLKTFFDNCFWWDFTKR